MTPLLFIDAPGCIYKSLDGTAEDQGNGLGHAIVGAIEDCEKSCDQMEGCQSFRWCQGAKQCYFKDKKTTELDPRTTSTICYTVYKTCNNGISNEKEY